MRTMHHTSPFNATANDSLLLFTFHNFIINTSNNKQLTNKLINDSACRDDGEMVMIVILVSALCNIVSVSSLVNQDAYPLLEFKESLQNSTVLSSWSYSSNPCSTSPSPWIGVTCGGNRVTRLVLDNHNLSGPITALARLDQLRLLSVNRNSLYSVGTVDFSGCTSLKHIYLAYNRLSGGFPTGIARLRRLRRLDISNNLFSGGIPESELGRLKLLVTVRLEGNAFTGELSGLVLPQSVKEFNVSRNKLVGEIPASVSAFPASSFLGNEELCGQSLPKSCLEKPITDKPLPLPTETEPQEQEKQGRNRSIVLMVIILSSVITLLFIALVAAYFYCSFRGRQQETVKDYYKQNQQKQVQQVQQQQWEEYWVGEKGLRDEDLLQASAEMLGIGRVGTTYKVTPEAGREPVVVKRVRAVGEKWNRKEVAQILGVVKKFKHRNLVEVRAYYCSREELLIVSDYFAAGSLHFLLHGNRGPARTPLTWPARLRLAAGAARGLAFLHENRCFHGHLTSANILFDVDGEAQVGDFNLHQLPPAHRRGPPAAEKTDVYDFGAILLELLTGKFAADNDPARLAVAGKELDLELVVGSTEVEWEMVAVLQVGLLCMAHKAHHVLSGPNVGRYPIS